MMYIKSIIQIIAYSLAFGTLFSQGIESGYDPLSDENINQKGRWFYQEGQLGNSICTTPDGYQIFEAGSNQNIINDDGFDTGDKPWKYIAFPKLSISQITEPRETSKGAAFNINIAASYPDREEVATFLQNSTQDRMVSRSDIQYLTIYGYLLEDQMEDLVIKSRSRTQLQHSSNALELVLTYSDLLTANKAYRRVISGTSLDFTLLANQRHLKSGCDFSIKSSDILESTAYRDFVSPLIGENISVDQAAQITDELVSEVTSQFQCRGNVSIFLETLTKDVFDALFSQRRVLSFEELAANEYLVDFDGKRYSPSEFKHFLQSNITEDVQRSSQSSSSQRRFIYDKQRKTLIDTKAKGGIAFNLIKGGGSIKTDIDRSVKRDQSQKSSNAQSSEEVHKSNVVLEFDGSVIVPRGILSHEVIGGYYAFEDRFSGSFQEHVQAFEPITIQVSYDL